MTAPCPVCAVPVTDPPETGCCPRCDAALPILAVACARLIRELAAQQIAEETA